MVLNTDIDWETFARQDPYFAVLTAPEFHRDQMTAETLARFFDSGDTQIEGIVSTLDRMFGKRTIRTALDFGCGVGRLLIPLGRRTEQVVGIDISITMRKLCERRLFRSRIEQCVAL